MKKYTYLIACYFLISAEIMNLPPPTGLMVELLRFPEKAVITDAIPEFSWIVPNSVTKQTAFQILVASDIDLLINGNADYWNSGKINSEESISISYSGKDLKPNQSYWWKVKFWDEAGNESYFSDPQKFITSNFSSATESKWKSEYLQLGDSTWVSENRQTAVFQKIEPVEIITIDSMNYFIDFGKAAFGTLELRLNSSIEDSAIVYLGERKNENFTVNKNPGKSNIGYSKFKINLNKGITDYKIVIPKHHSNSPNHQELAPFYPEVMPFRFVEINSGHKIIIKNIRQNALFYPFNESSSNFISSNKNLNEVWNLCKYTLKATPFLGVYADGNRERMPYEADSYIQQLGHYSVDREYSIARYTANFLLNNPSWPTEWHMHTIFMAWEDYLYTGDKEFLEENYELLKMKTFFSLEREDGLISTAPGKVTEEFLKKINFQGKKLSDIVDWPKGTPLGEIQAGNAGPTPEGERDGFVFTNINTVVNVFHYKSLEVMSKIADVLGNDQDKLFFETRAEKVRLSILEKLYDRKSGLFIDGEGTSHSSLQANMFALAFNIQPETNLTNVIKFIKSKGMACSVYGAQYLLDALFNVGESDYAISLMSSENKRSWMNMINSGSTMTTEAWDEYFKPNLTWNHAWGSAPANVIVRRMVGILPLESGFKSFAIIPQPGYLNFIKLKTPTIRGTIEYNLFIDKLDWKMEVSVPGNSTAFLYLPSKFKNVMIDDENILPSKTKNIFHEDRNIYILKCGFHNITAN